MSFFSKKQKQIALKINNKTIKERYRQTEFHLKKCARTGNEKELKKAMAEHRDIEYALLYKQTPEYVIRTINIRNKIFTKGKNNGKK